MYSNSVAVRPLVVGILTTLLHVVGGRAKVDLQRLGGSLLGAYVAYSSPCRSPIPAQADHPFQLMPITDSSACRSSIPAHRDHFRAIAGIGFEH